MKSPSWSFWCIRWNKNPLTLWSSNLCLTSTILLGPNGGGKLIHLKVETVRPYPTVHVKFGKSSTQVGSQVTRRLCLSYPRGIRCGSFLGNKRVTKIKLFWWGIITAFRDVQSGATNCQTRALTSFPHFCDWIQNGTNSIDDPCTSNSDQWSTKIFSSREEISERWTFINSLYLNKQSKDPDPEWSLLGERTSESKSGFVLR